MRFINWYNRNFIVIEFFIAILLVTGFVIWSESFAGFVQINNWLFGIRKELYSTIASITGALLGFIITSVSIVIALCESRIFKLLKESKNYKTVFMVFTTSIKYLAFSTVVSLVGLIGDKDPSPHIWITYLAFWGMLLSIFSIIRCLWVIEKLVEITVKNSDVNK